MNLLIRAKWAGAYLLVPPLLAFMVYTEGYLAAHEVAGVFSPHQHTVLAVWNASLLLTLIAGIKSCLFFSKLWGGNWFRNSLSLPVSRASGYWGPYLAVLSVATVMYLLTTVAVVAALPDIHEFPWTQVLVESYAPVIWSVSIGALLGILTSGASASVLFTALLLIGFLTGLPSLFSSSWWWLRIIAPPIGRIMSLSLAFPKGIMQIVILLAHSAVVLFLGRLLYGIGTKRK